MSVRRTKALLMTKPYDSGATACNRTVCSCLPKYDTNGEVCLSLSYDEDGGKTFSFLFFSFPSFFFPPGHRVFVPVLFGCFIVAFGDGV